MGVEEKTTKYPERSGKMGISERFRAFRVFRLPFSVADVPVARLACQKP